MTSGTFWLLHEMDRWELGEQSETDAAFMRMAVNLNKMRSAQSSHEIVVSGIELLGGNGAIESFSVLPRLLRDNVVFENWEGTHNVLLMQVLRDARRLNLHRGFFARLSDSTAGHPRLAAEVARGRSEMDEVLALDDGAASLRMRPLGARLAWIQWAAAMVAEGTEAEVVDHFLDRRLGPEAARDAAYLKRIAAVSGAA
jgi:acyl-CoA dehydrogenase